MKAAGSPVFAAFAASAAAGPLFLALCACAYLYGQLPHPITVAAADFGMFAALMAPAFIVGFIIAFVPNLLGSAVMATIGESADWGRSPVAWSLAGGFAGAGLALLFYPRDAEAWPGIFALVLTSAICARICRAFMAWEA
jgi:hypothetical protein